VVVIVGELALHGCTKLNNECYIMLVFLILKRRPIAEGAIIDEEKCITELRAEH
jgi:hypothetical protein